MTHQINFKEAHQYKSSKAGITIPTTLLANSQTVECAAKIDTGAEYCLFRRDYADRLQLDLESGHFLVMETLTGSFDTYGHEVTLMTFDLAFDVMVYFAADYDIRRNLLGRNGWLNLVLLGLNAYDEILYLSNYDNLPT